VSASSPVRVTRLRPSAAVACPRCGSIDTTQTSYFGSTACKALYKCLSCLEPFDHFKPH
jgi:ring-1,2-phenylacetyl-CoA epoxidase subunit PaaD